MSHSNEKELDQNAIKRLEASSDWLITEATGKLYADSSYSKLLQRELIKKYKLTSYNSPKIGVEDQILRYIPKARGIYYDIELLQEAIYINKIYEYWRISISSKDWATTQSKECRFIVTQASSKIENRKILKKEYQFFHNFNVDGTEVIYLDYENNLKLRYKLLPWHFQECYKNYPEITKKEVIVLKNGDYATVPYE